jgi:hypothetical protein
MPKMNQPNDPTGYSLRHDYLGVRKKKSWYQKCLEKINRWLLLIKRAKCKNQVLARDVHYTLREMDSPDLTARAERESSSSENH